MDSSSSRSLRIFLCHSSADKPAVRELYQRLRADGFEPWLDEEDLLPGQDWQREIPKAVRNSDVVIVCLSRDSITKRGYVNKEIKVALDVADDWHDLTSTTDRVPCGFHAVPDTDYEYAAYLTSGGSELWRYLAPGVPRVHDWPRQPKAKTATGPVSGAKHVVKREGTTYVYELAIPKEELAQLKLAAGTTLGVMLRAGNSSGPHVDFGTDKAVTKKNGLTLHPYWERSSNCGVRWKLVE